MLGLHRLGDCSASVLSLLNWLVPSGRACLAVWWEAPTSAAPVCGQEDWSSL